MRHAIKRMSPVDVLAAVVSRVTGGTGTQCLTDPDDEESPFYFAEIVSSRPGRSKTMRVDVFDVAVHAISTPSDTREGVLGMVASLEEAMERDVDVPAPFWLVGQDDLGIQTIKRDPSREWHAVVGFELSVSYGLVVK